MKGGGVHCPLSEYQTIIDQLYSLFFYFPSLGEPAERNRSSSGINKLNHKNIDLFKSTPYGALFFNDIVNIYDIREIDD